MTTISGNGIVVLLVLVIHLAPSQAVCNCGPDWNSTQCTVDNVKHGDCSAPPQPFQEVIPSTPSGIRPQYFVDGNDLGIAVTFTSPRENASLARIFDVTVIALDYPVGFQMCARVRLDASIRLKENQSFRLQCIHSKDLIPRQRYGVMVQPYPTDRNRSNMIRHDYRMPSCCVGGVSNLKMCNNYNDPERWRPKFLQVQPGSCGGLCVRVFFDTYQWPNDRNISTYQISICTNICPKQYTKLVDCTDSLNSGEYICNTTFYGLDPGEYRARQRLKEDNGQGNVLTGVIKASAKFHIPDPGAPTITQIPKNITIYVQGTNETVTVTWIAPNVSNYIASKVNLTSNYEPGDNFTVGVWTVTYFAEDYYKHRKSKVSFTISIIDQASGNVHMTETTTVTTRPLARHAASKTEDSSRKLLIGGVAGGTTALLLLIFIMFIKDFKRLVNMVKKGSSRLSQTPTESIDPTSNESDNLDRNLKVVHHPGSCDNALCDGSVSEYPTYEGDELVDKCSLDGHVFGPSLQPSHQCTPKVTVNFNIMAGLPNQSTSWVTSAHVENGTRSQFVEPKPAIKKKLDFDRLVSLSDPSFGEHPEIQSITQVSFTDEF